MKLKLKQELCLRELSEVIKMKIPEIVIPARIKEMENDKNKEN